MTTTAPAYRRAPYGANPNLGQHGNRARADILAAAGDLFAEVGYHSVTVDEIARRAGRSSPSVYQYFENKEQIFRIFVEELGAELIDHAKTMGDITGPDGPDAMRAFIDGLSTLFCKHRVTAIEWPSVEAAGHQLRSPAETFLQRFATATLPHLGLTDPRADDDPLRSLPMSMLSIVQWAEYTRESRRPNLPRERLNDSLALLFHHVIAGDIPQWAPAAGVSKTDPATTPADLVSTVGMRRTVTSRSRPMVERILTAASQEFGRKGYAGTNIQQIAEQAGIGKPNVYTYWKDREALFSTLADAASVALRRVLSRDLSAEVLNSPDGGREWLDDWLDLVIHHGAVLHIWTHGGPANAVLSTLADDMTVFVSAHLTILVPGEDAKGDDLTSILLWALLVEFPYTMSVQLPELERPELRELLLLFIHRGLPAIGNTTTTPQTRGSRAARQ